MWMVCLWTEIYYITLHSNLIVVTYVCSHLSPTIEHTCFAGTATEPTSALLLSLTGSARRVVLEEIGCNKWKKTLAYLLVLPGSRGPGSFDVEDATTLSWSSAAVSE